MDIVGQRIFVLGGTGSFGLAVARAAIVAGADVVVLSPSSDKVEAAVAELGDRASGRVVDVNDEAGLERVFAELGAFDHLVMAVGDVIKIPPFREATVAEAKAGFETRFWGQYSAARIASRTIASTGSISFTSAASSQKSMHSAVLGGAVNSAVEGLVRQLAVELAPVRVNAVAPGVMATNRWKGMAEEEREAFFAKVAGALPARRVGTADDVAEAFMYLLRSTFSTGSTLFVEGGALVAP